VGLSELLGNKLFDLGNSIYILLFFLAHSSIGNAVFFTTTVMQTVYPEEITVENIAFFLEQMHCTEM